MMEMQGTPERSQASATGLVVSGVELTSIRSILSPVMRSTATSPAHSGSDWLSLTRISTGWARPPISRPSLNACWTLEMTKLSASPKANSAPLCGLT
jgi:hypothetical protein